MADNVFEYTIYVATDSHRLWQALTDPADTNRWWGVRFDTDWQAGSPMVWESAGARVDDPDQRVVEAEPSRRLAYTWHGFTSEWAHSHGFGDDVVPIASAEPVSTVRFELEQLGPLEGLPTIVKLSVVHDGFPADSVVRASVARDWPAALSSLKTLLETGQPLPSVHAYEK
ncbi:hypothetical protein A5791_01405 [Mycobacterium sp. 852002-51163_SCH5372311]|uniref:SRPBCC family protein n=1 Tax=Mycobacterium sp. 852002-51163_SCH5372311 TaxID=1834097 RepID=UPI0007FE1170|nr:SRPBCC family protein [Mycobacterium sp. 852002-51163_SCH5372311]OBF86132.1 hypothetical protein A5791_01405 [Mycobacterium sp. 852002-51163_SCH5372311]